MRLKLKLPVHKSKSDNYHIGHRLEDLRDVLNTTIRSVSPGDEYMRGLANGLLLAWYIMAETYGMDVPFFEKGEASEITMTTDISMVNG